MKKIMLMLLAGLLAMSLAACQEKEPPVSGGDMTDEPGKVRIFNEGGDQVHSSVARYVRVDGELYTDTGEIITLARCGVMDGEITKTVAETELPGEDDCSNFGTGYQYQIAGVYSIDVVIDGDWCRRCRAAVMRRRLRHWGWRWRLTRRQSLSKPRDLSAPEKKLPPMWKRRFSWRGRNVRTMM